MSDDQYLLNIPPKPQNPPEIIIEIPGDLDQSRGYKVGRWGQHFNYECLSCQYSTLWEQKMIAHIAEGQHPWSFPEGSVVKCSGEPTPNY